MVDHNHWEFFDVCYQSVKIWLLYDYIMLYCHFSFNLQQQLGQIAEWNFKKGKLKSGDSKL